MTDELSDRDYAIEIINELEEMLKRLILKTITGAEGEARYLMHTSIQVIRLARVKNVIKKNEQPVLEAMLAVRNKLTHHNGLSFSSEDVERLMKPVRGFPEVRGDCDRAIFGLAYREFVIRFNLRSGGHYDNA